MSSAPAPSSSSGPLRRSLSVVATPLMAAATWAPAGGPAGAAGAAGGAAGGGAAELAASSRRRSRRGRGGRWQRAPPAVAAAAGSAVDAARSGTPPSAAGLLVFRGPDIDDSSATLGMSDRDDARSLVGPVRDGQARSCETTGPRTCVRPSRTSERTTSCKRRTMGICCARSPRGCGRLRRTSVACCGVPPVPPDDR